MSRYPRTRYVRSRLAVTDHDINALLAHVGAMDAPEAPEARRALRQRRAAGRTGV